MVFDLSDVIDHFRSVRLPTGIQRVQIEIVEHAIRKASFDFSIACFTKEANYWIEIPRGLFATLAFLSAGDFADTEWKALARRLETAIATAATFVFPSGGILLNLGSSWWLQNYFLGVRHAKARFGIQYVPFIHDLIPMAMPELCVAITLRPAPEQDRQIVLDIASDSLADFRARPEGRDVRVCGIGIKWFFVCRENDLEARMYFIDIARTEHAAWFGAGPMVESRRHSPDSPAANGAPSGIMAQTPQASGARP